MRLNQMTKSKYTKLESRIVETLGWLLVVCFFAGIWYNEYRWKLIFTSIAIFVFLMLYIVSKDWEENKK